MFLILVALIISNCSLNYFIYFSKLGCLQINSKVLYVLYYLQSKFYLEFIFDNLQLFEPNWRLDNILFNVNGGLLLINEGLWLFLYFNF